jgi:hypothetical protein
MGTFKKLHTLEILSLTLNNLKSIENGIICDLKSLVALDLSSNQIVFIQKELLQKLSRLLYLNLCDNLIQDLDDTAFTSLTSLKFVNLRINPVVHLFKNQTFAGLSQLKWVGISDRVYLDVEIIRLIKNQMTPRLVHEWLDMTFYDSIEITYTPNFTTPYTSNICYYIGYLIRNQILFNLEDDLFVEKFITDCKDWSTLVYRVKLQDTASSIFV